MSAPDLPTLYDFEGQLEPVAMAALVAAFLAAGVTCQVLTSQDSETEITPRVNLRVVLGGVNNQRTAIGQAAPKQVPNSYAFTVIASVATTRPVDKTANLHGVIRGIVRTVLADSSKIFNGMAYLQVLQLLPSSTTPDLQTNKEQDISHIAYDGWFAVRNDAWPSVA